MRNPEVWPTQLETLVSQSKASNGVFLWENRRLDLSAPLKGTAHEF